MTKILVALVAALALVSGTAATAHADVPWARYGLTPTAVAGRMDCDNPRHQVKPSTVGPGAVTCDLGRFRVDIFTFRTPRQQRIWVQMIRSGAPVSQGSHHMAVARGIVVVAHGWRAKGAMAAAEILRCPIVSF